MILILRAAMFEAPHSRWLGELGRLAMHLAKYRAIHKVLVFMVYNAKRAIIPTLVLIALFSGFVVPRLAFAEYRIAVVEPNRVVEQSPQYEAAGKALEAELSKREKALRAQKEEIAALKGKLENSGALMSEAELRRLENDIRSRSRRLKYAQDEFHDDFSLRQNELRTKLAQQVQEVVEELAKEQGIDLIVSEGIVYFSERIDISDQVIERLKQKFNTMQ